MKNLPKSCLVLNYDVKYSAISKRADLSSPVWYLQQNTSFVSMEYAILKLKQNKLESPNSYKFSGYYILINLLKFFSKE